MPVGVRSSPARVATSIVALAMSVPDGGQIVIVLPSAM